MYSNLFGTILPYPTDLESGKQKYIHIYILLLFDCILSSLPKVDILIMGQSPTMSIEVWMTIYIQHSQQCLLLHLWRWWDFDCPAPPPPCNSYWSIYCPTTTMTTIYEYFKWRNEQSIVIRLTSIMSATGFRKYKNRLRLGYISVTERYMSIRKKTRHTQHMYDCYMIYNIQTVYNKTFLKEKKYLISLFLAIKRFV